MMERLTAWNCSWLSRLSVITSRLEGVSKGTDNKAMGNRDTANKGMDSKGTVNLASKAGSGDSRVTGSKVMVNQVSTLNQDNTANQDSTVRKATASKVPTQFIKVTASKATNKPRSKEAGTSRAAGVNRSRADGTNPTKVFTHRAPTNPRIGEGG